MPQTNDDTATGNPYATGEIEVPDSGGYRTLAVLDDGEVLCSRCTTDPTNPVHPDKGENDGWGVIGFTHTGNSDEPEYCAHCGNEV